MKEILCGTDKEIFLHMFHVILDMKVTVEIFESDDSFVHSIVVIQFTKILTFEYHHSIICLTRSLIASSKANYSDSVV